MLKEKFHRLVNLYVDKKMQEEGPFNLLEFVKTSWAKKCLCIVYADTPFLERHYELGELYMEACVVGDMPTHNYEGLQFYNSTNTPHNTINTKYIFIVYEKEPQQSTIDVFYKTIVPLLSTGDYYCCMYYEPGAILNKKYHQMAIVADERPKQ